MNNYPFHKRTDFSKCTVCGGSMWTDDDLHWYWCSNGACKDSFGSKDNEERMREFYEIINARENRARQLEG